MCIVVIIIVAYSSPSIEPVTEEDSIAFNNLYSFFEVIFLKYSKDKAAPAVKHFLAKLNVL